jgi:REP element-mobilizing transposase RayT
MSRRIRDLMRGESPREAAYLRRMSRDLRIQAPEAFFHVSTHSTDDQLLYPEDEDCLEFCDLFAKVVKRFEWRCHAYVLMGTHNHMLLETQQANLSRGMQYLNGVYAQRFNRRHRRAGPTQRARFWSVPIESDAHVFELSRYFPMNPVRGGMCPHPGDWPWSSYRPMLGTAEAPPFLTTSWLLKMFDEDIDRARVLYRRFVDESLDDFEAHRKAMRAFAKSSHIVT